MATKKICFPAEEEAIRELKIGDELSISGIVITGRDMAHKYIVEEKPEWLRELLYNGAIYHCGPVMKKRGDGWEVISAGPTTSIREEPYEHIIINEYKVRGIMGKGGMGEKTLSALKQTGAVYIHLVGGAGVYTANYIKEVKGVYKLEEFGIPEAIWVLEVKGLKGVVTMDSHGFSLHEEIERKSYNKLISLL